MNPHDYYILRRLMSDVLLLLNEFRSSSEYAGFMTATVRERVISDLAVRCRNMMTYPESVSAASLSVPAAPPLPMPELDPEVKARAEQAEIDFLKFAGKVQDSEIDDAMRWTGDNYAEMYTWLTSWDASNPWVTELPDGVLYLSTLDGDMVAQPGDLIVRTVAGRFVNYKGIEDNL